MHVDNLITKNKLHAGHEHNELKNWTKHNTQGLARALGRYNYSLQKRQVDQRSDVFTVSTGDHRGSDGLFCFKRVFL